MNFPSRGGSREALWAAPPLQDHISKKLLLYNNFILLKKKYKQVN